MHTYGLVAHHTCVDRPHTYESHVSPHWNPKLCRVHKRRQRTIEASRFIEITSRRHFHTPYDKHDNTLIAPPLQQISKYSPCSPCTVYVHTALLLFFAPSYQHNKSDTHSPCKHVAQESPIKTVLLDRCRPCERRVIARS